MSKHEQAKPIQVTVKNKEWDSTYQLLSWWKPEVIKAAKVMVVGAGALGNEVLKNLTLLNVGNILIVDFDHIEYSNLSRSVLYREKDCERKALKAEIAAERIQEINSNVKVMYLNGDVTIDVGLGVFRRMDVVIGCLDNRLARLFLNRACYKVDKTWVDGAIENLTGQVDVYKPYATCYECSLTKADWQNIKFRLGCVDVAKRNYSQGRIPTTPISSSIVAAMQTQEALKVVNKNDKKLMLESFYYEGMNNMVLQLAPKPLKEDCQSHFSYENIIESPLKSTSTIQETLEWLKNHFEEEDPFIQLDNEVALRLVTRNSEKAYQVCIPKLKLTDEKIKEYQQEGDEELMITDETKEVDVDFPYLDKCLQEVGIPPLHIMQVYAQGDFHFVELTGDEAYLNFT
jgi:adenylyltransferase/sulfurtransferase